MKFLIPFVHKLNTTQIFGALGGATGAGTMAMFASSGTTRNGWLNACIVGCSMLVGTLVGVNGAGCHTSSNEAAFGVGVIEGACFGGTLYHTLDVHGPHASRCSKCGWMGMDPPGHICQNPSGVV